MSEIPADIDRIASDIVRADYSADDEPDYAFYLAIAKAILAERERCLAIADKEYRSHCTGSGFDSQPSRATAFSIREAIAAPKGE